MPATPWERRRLAELVAAEVTRLIILRRKIRVSLSRLPPQRKKLARRRRSRDTVGKRFERQRRDSTGLVAISVAPKPKRRVRNAAGELAFAVAVAALPSIRRSRNCAATLRQQ